VTIGGNPVLNARSTSRSADTEQAEVVSLPITLS
jgi:hypothetical protein